MFFERKYKRFLMNVYSPMFVKMSAQKTFINTIKKYDLNNLDSVDISKEEKLLKKLEDQFYNLQLIKKSLEKHL